MLVQNHILTVGVLHKMVNQLNSTRLGRATMRFIKVVGGQVGGAAISAAIAYSGAYNYTSPEGVVVGVVLGSFLTALQKWWSERVVVE